MNTVQVLALFVVVYLVASPTLIASPLSDIFQSTVVPEIRIDITPQNISNLWIHPRSFVPATVFIGTNRWLEVGVHLKGGSGSLSPLNKQPSLTLKFNKFLKSQTLGDFAKIHLNNSLQDSGLLSEFMAAEVFKASKVPTPRVDHGIVWLNDRLLGVYVATEGVDDRFLRRHFTGQEGNLYQGNAGQDLGPQLTQTGGNRKDSTLALLHTTLAMPRGAPKESLLRERVDMPAFYSFMAAEILASHGDGYCLGPNNYRVYAQPANGPGTETSRIELIPHGADMAMGSADAPVMPASGASLAHSVLESPRMRAEYRTRLRELVYHHIKVEPIRRRVEEASKRLQVALAKAAPERVEMIATNAEAMVSLLRQRLKSAKEQLPLHPKPIEPERNATPGKRMYRVPPSGWKPYREFGQCEFGRTNSVDGAESLTVTARQPQFANMGTWRAVVSMSPGSYGMRVEAVEVFSSQHHQRDPARAWIQIGSGDRIEATLRGPDTVSQLQTDITIVGRQETEITLGYRGLVGQVRFSVKLERR